MTTGAAAITPDNFLAVRTINGLQAMLLHAGMSLEQAKEAAMAMINGLLQQQSFINSVDDVFMVLAFIAFVGLVPVLFLKENRAVGGKTFEPQH